MPTEKLTVLELLDQAQRTFAERNKTYGDAYKRFGDIMVLLFPNDFTGETIPDKDLWNRFGVLCQMVNCLIRFAESGCEHRDSVHDLGVFCFMMEDLLQ